MIEIEKEEDCCGCEACCQICPTNCISMVPDSKGFFYPRIEKKNCISCNLCVTVCPMN